MAKIKLPRDMRDTLEAYGVIEPPAVPKLEVIEEAVRDRDGRMDLAIGRDGLTAARVEIGEMLFTASNDVSNLAATDALCQALRATQPRQQGLFGDDDDDSGGGGGSGPDDDRPRGPSPNGGGDVVVGEYRAIEPGSTMLVSELTGEAFTAHEPEEVPAAGLDKEAIERIQVEASPSDNASFDEGGDELARKQRMVDALQACGIDIELVDGVYTEPDTGIEMEDAYVEHEYELSLIRQAKLDGTDRQSPATAG